MVATIQILTISCKKSPNDPEVIVNSPSSSLEANQIETMLNNFWANYSSYKNVTTELTTLPDLEGTLNESEMLTTLHFGLNVSIVNPDTTYEQNATQEFVQEIPMTIDEKVKNLEICKAFDQIMLASKNYTLTTPYQEKTINSIQVETNEITTNSIKVRVRITYTFGDFYATSDINWSSQSSSYLNKFQPTYQIPWVSHLTTNQKTPLDYYRFYANLLLRNSWNVTNSDIGTINNLLPSGQAAHNVLSNNALTWADPRTANAALTTINYKLVLSPDRVNNVDTKFDITNKIERVGEPAQNPNDKIIPIDVPILCGVPSIPNQVQGNERFDDILPSALPGFYDTEYHYGLQNIRNFNGTQMNFFWQNRNKIAEVAFNKRASIISQKLGQIGFGHYRIKQLNYIVHAWEQPYSETNNTCLSYHCISSNETRKICKLQYDYRADVVFSHYSLQKMPPIHWRNLVMSAL